MTLGRQMPSSTNKLDPTGACFTEALALLNEAFFDTRNSICSVSKCDLFWCE